MVRRTLRGVAGFGAALLCVVGLGGGEGRADTSVASVARLSVGYSQKLFDGQAAVLLSDGRWLLVGGKQLGSVSGAVSFSDSRSSELQKQSPLPTPQISLVYPRSGESATVLPDGTVAVLGGTGADGKIVSAAEILDPQTGEDRVIASTGLQPRSFHTATVLTDGQVLIAGGLGPDGQPLSSAELWDPATGSSQPIDSGLAAPRSNQQATLLSNGTVLISGGSDSTGQSTTSAEIYDPRLNAFSPLSAADGSRTASNSAATAPSVEEILPSTDANDVGVDARIAIRLNAPAALGPDTSRAVSVVGPSGNVAGKVIAAEGGLLLFFTPSVDLLPQSTYTVFVHGVTDRSGQSLPFNASSFTTRSFNDATQPSVSRASRTSSPVAQKTSSASSGTQLLQTPAATSTTTAKPTTKPAVEPNKPAEDDSGPEDWNPREKNRHGTWRVLGLSGDPVLLAPRVTNLSAPAGETAVAGRVLRYHGRPLAGVAVRIGDKSGVTDSSGRFLLTGLAPGVKQLQIDGTTVISGGRHYTKHFVRVEVVAGKTQSIGEPVYLPRVDPATEVTIPSPTTRELVLTHPAIPGLEVHIPKGVVLREYDGKIVTKLSITPVPLDRPPYPTPTSFSVYFTLQPGGAFIDADASKSIRVIYPNYAGLAPGARPNFWNYDPAEGWQVYGQGTVSADGKQIIPDANVGFRQIISFGMGIDNSRKPAKRAPPVSGCVRGGDPVDCATGIFLHTATDLAIRDVVPISATRTYQQVDTEVRAFGVGTNLSYNLWLYTPTTSGTPQEIDLVLADGSRVLRPAINESSRPELFEVRQIW